MHYKIQGAIKRNRTNFIIFAILWIVIAIGVVAPFCYSTYLANTSGEFDLKIFMEKFAEMITNPFTTIGGIFEEGIIGNYFSMLLIATIFYSIVFFIGFVRSAPKNEFSDIEHGSSDWSQHGEQYKVINKNKGIILAENNYLPVDKRGNVNVLVVGRFWCW